MGYKKARAAMNVALATQEADSGMDISAMEPMELLQEILRSNLRQEQLLAVRNGDAPVQKPAAAKSAKSDLGYGQMVS
jgi:hypothetical protein